MTDVLFTNVSIFDGTGIPSFDGEVLVSGNRIESVRHATGPRPSSGLKVVDGAGATLMPGLVNCHGHGSYPNIRDLYHPGEIPPEEHILVTMHNVRTMLDYGFTAVVSGASAKDRLDIVIRNEIEAGRIPGPRLQACTPELTVTGGLGDVEQMHLEHKLVAVVLDGRDHIRQYVRTMIREGVDSIKLMLSGDNFVRTATAEMTVMQEDEVEAASSIARAHGKRLIAHARTSESVKMCVRHGIELIYHANFVDGETLDMLEDGKDRFFVGPAIGLSYATLHAMEPYGVSHTTAEDWGFGRELEAAVERVPEMHRRGIRVLPFGDYGFAWNPIGTDAKDLEHFVKLMGFSPLEVLTMATKYGGECYGIEIGQIRAGYLADLLLVDGDPVADVTVLQDRENLLAIMKDGEFYKSPPLSE